MVEADLPIRQNGEYKNIDLKSKPLKGIKGLEEGDHIIVEKLYDACKEHTGKFGKFYTTAFKYKNETVGVIFNAKEREAFDGLGGANTRIKIIGTKNSFVNPKTGGETVFPGLMFEVA